MRKTPESRKEWLLLVAMLLLFVAVLSVMGLLFRKQGKETVNKEEELVIIQGSISSPAGNQRQQQDRKPVQLGESTFFIKPSVTEILASLREIEPLGSKALTGDNPTLQVIWPGYFFSLAQENSGVATVLLDVDENGFGTLLRCLVKLKDYPEIRNLQPGRKIWVAGKISDIDLAGDGIVTIDVEFVQFDGDPEPMLPTGEHNQNS